jgi:hypothetical protein
LGCSPCNYRLTPPCNGPGPVTKSINTTPHPWLGTWVQFPTSLTRGVKAHILLSAYIYCLPIYMLQYPRGPLSRLIQVSHSFMIVIVLFGLTLTQMLLGRVIALIVTLLHVTVFSLVPLPLHGNLRSRLLYLDLVQKQNFEALLLLLQRLYG